MVGEVAKAYLVMGEYFPFSFSLCRFSFLLVPFWILLFPVATTIETGRSAFPRPSPFSRLDFHGFPFDFQRTFGLTLAPHAGMVI